MGSGKNTVIDIASGTAGGFAQVVAGHPLDTIKVRLQTQKPGPDGKFPFAGMADCAKKTFAKEGVKGLYKGAASPLVGAMAHNAGVFFSYGQAKALTGANEVGADLYKYFLAGAISAIPITLVETPVDLLKIKLQAQVGEGEYAGVFDAAGKLGRAHGVAGLYQGFGATMLRNIPCFGLYFFGSEFGFRLINTPGEPTTPKQVFIGGLVGGACAGGLFWGVLYPLETIKTRMQSDHILKEKRLYSSVLDCAQKTYAEGGVGAFFKGYIPSLTRAVPVNAAIFCAVFNVKDAMYKSWA